MLNPTGIAPLISDAPLGGRPGMRQICSDDARSEIAPAKIRMKLSVATRSSQKLTAGPLPELHRNQAEPCLLFYRAA
jgi:hypothetical protein